MSKLFWFLCLFICVQGNVFAQIHVTFTGLTNKPSTLYIGIYNQDNVFMGDEAHYVAAVKVNGATLSWTCKDLAPGKYALTVYQDVNNNGKMDKGMFGVPTEPYGFSGNPVIAFKAPTFKDCLLMYTGQPIEIQVIMK